MGGLHSLCQEAEKKRGRQKKHGKTEGETQIRPLQQVCELEGEKKPSNVIFPPAPIPDSGADGRLVGFVRAKPGSTTEVRQVLGCLGAQGCGGTEEKEV